MDKLVFKTFTWPMNPETCQESFLREPLYVKTDDGKTVFSGMGAMKRVITGSGAFLGADAYSNFKKLSKLFEDAALGTLTHPVWGDRSVYFTELQASQSPKENYVAYSFTFTEADADGAIPV